MKDSRYQVGKARAKVRKLREHEPGCPLAQAWDHGEWEARCRCDELREKRPPPPEPAKGEP